MKSLNTQSILFLSVIVLATQSLTTVTAGIDAENISYNKQQQKTLKKQMNDQNPDDNTKLSISGSNNVILFNTSDPDSFRLDHNKIKKQVATGAKLYSNGDLEISIDFDGVPAETRTIANININTGKISEGSRANPGKTIDTITNVNKICVLTGSAC